MDEEDLEEPPVPDRVDSRIGQVVCGLFLAVWTLPLFLSGIGLIWFAGTERSIPLAVLGLPVVLIGLVTIEASARLIFNKPRLEGEFIHPWLLILSGAIFTLIPFGWLLSRPESQERLWPWWLYAASLFYFLIGGISVFTAFRRIKRGRQLALNK